MADLELLKKLCLLPGISGREEAVREAILEEIRPYVSSVTVSPLGNLIVEKKGAAPAKIKLMLCAHMDEVGFIVTHITSEGLLQFDKVGGILDSVICGRAVTVWGKNGPLEGVIGCVPLHLGKVGDKPLPADELYIDIGAADPGG